jgi:ribonuclease D
VTALAERLNMPQENLITPDTVRRVCWEPPQPADAASVAAALARHGARPWQVEQVTPVLVAALAADG